MIFITNEGNLIMVTKDFWAISNQFHHLGNHIQGNYFGDLNQYL